MKTKLQYAELTSSGYRHVYPSIAAVRACSPKGPVHIVTVTVDEERGDQFAWLKTNGEISMIWPKRMLLDMCFTYGMEAEEKRGRGRCVRVSVTKATPSPDETPELYECEACASQPGSPTLCSRCLRQRDWAQDLWQGPPWYPPRES